jgi:hypothetical protein
MNQEPKKFTAEFLNNLIKKLRLEYAEDPNVKHISWGLGKSKNELNKGVCIIFTVDQKISSDKLRKSIGTRTIPEMIEGVPTDVNETKLEKRASAVGSRGDVTADPLNGGWSTSNADNHTIWFNGWGTIALLCTDNTNGDLMALSNWHVWADGGEEGNTIIQPGTPRAGDHVEGATKVLACGPLLTSLLEWESPDPIAAGLYGGAAAAAIAAALSDYRDPSRRGQDATIPLPGEKTIREKIVVDTSYLDLPIPGTPFKTDVKWSYERHTDSNIHYHSVSEGQINAQFLLGKYVTTDQQKYKPGEEAQIYAAIWDYQPRPCDSYHVVAHMISDKNPSLAHPVVLHSSPCPKKMPWYPPSEKDTKKNCYDFGQYKPGKKFPYKYHFDWLTCYNLSKTDLLMVDWQISNGGSGKGELAIGQKGLRFVHNPVSGVKIKVATYTNNPITVQAFDHMGNLLGIENSSGNSGVAEWIEISIQGIAYTIVNGGNGEGIVMQYCLDTEIKNEQFSELNHQVIKRLETAHVKYKERNDKKVKSTRCCFHGSFRIPASEPEGRWTVYLTVQNINNVPMGTKPEVAAETIGGHLLAAPAAQSAGACAFMMLGDHVFDIF